MQVKIPCNQALPIYKVLASKIKELKALGLSINEIASKLKIHKKTVMRGLVFQIDKKMRAINRSFKSSRCGTAIHLMKNSCIV
jgi:DNA-binding NarL/FixJ family response regulator